MPLLSLCQCALHDGGTGGLPSALLCRIERGTKRGSAGEKGRWGRAWAAEAPAAAQAQTRGSAPDSSDPIGRAVGRRATAARARAILQSLADNQKGWRATSSGKQRDGNDAPLLRADAAVLQKVLEDSLLDVVGDGVPARLSAESLSAALAADSRHPSLVPEDLAVLDPVQVVQRSSRHRTPAGGRAQGKGKGETQVRQPEARDVPGGQGRHGWAHGSVAPPLWGTGDSRGERAGTAGSPPDAPASISARGPDRVAGTSLHFVYR